MKQLVSTDWLENNLNNVRIIDGTWHMPNTKRNSQKEFEEMHIPNSVFFDLDKNSNQESNLPHMMPTEDQWNKLNSTYGIKNDDQIIIYDNSDVMSSCRWWFSYIFFGHNPNLVSILNGGLKKWVKEEKKITSKILDFKKSYYISKINNEFIFNKKQIDENIIIKKYLVVDARAKERFSGLVAETRKGLRSGNIKDSKNLPFKFCINETDNTFKNKEELKKIFTQFKVSESKEKVFSCGSGVTACILGLANSIISGKTPLVYDGSWAEYGRE